MWVPQETKLNHPSGSMLSVCERPLGRDAFRAPETSMEPERCDASFNRAAHPPSAAEAWTAVILLLTSLGQLERWVEMGNYPTWVAQFINPKVVPIIFYPTAEPWFKSHEPKYAHSSSWQAKSLRARRCPEPDANVTGTKCTKWVNDKLQLILTCPIDMVIPLLYGGNLQASRAIRPASFCGRGLFNGEYTVANKWVVYPMFKEPILDYFDYFAKIDVDVCFRRPVQLGDIIEPLLLSRSHFFHSGLLRDNPACEATLGDFMQLYHSQFPCPGWRAAAMSPPWKPFGEVYEHPPVSYGNFIGGWLGFWQSERVLHFARLWWEWAGGWVHRFTDQQYWMAALWVMGANETVLDLSRLRYSLFRHSKARYPCGGEGEGTPAASEASAIFNAWREVERNVSLNKPQLSSKSSIRRAA